MKNKYYQVKVYDKSGTYLTTWSDIISNIEFNNEINSAGGQMKITLARNAGDYGEGSDLDFGYRVKIYVFDKELPEGSLLFQGYISAYTPIYKDDKVEVIVLSAGAELQDYMLEKGEELNDTNGSNDDLFYFGNYGSPGDNIYLLQQFEANKTMKISRFEFMMKTLPYIDSFGNTVERLNIPCEIALYTSSYGFPGIEKSRNTFIVPNGTLSTVSLKFPYSVTLTGGNNYVLLMGVGEGYEATGSGNYPLAIARGNTTGLGEYGAVAYRL